MPLKIQRRVIELVIQVTGGSLGEMPQWLVRPGAVECRSSWSLVSEMFFSLTGTMLPREMRPVERRTVDAVLVIEGLPHRILEIDEKQHFNGFRAQTLSFYPPDLRLAFDRTEWQRRSLAKRTLEAGGFAAPRPPLFPGPGGRHRQRAFRDALTDVLPALYGMAPTMRIADFEVAPWMFNVDAPQRMAALLTAKLACAAA